MQILDLLILSAQAVPSAALLPCLAALPFGWQAGGADIASGKTRLWLDSDRVGPRAVTVTLTASCDTSGARQLPSDQPGTSRFERPLSLVPAFSGLRFCTFPGGCVTYEFRFRPGASPVLAVAVDSALAFQSRSSLVRQVWRTENLVLCGRGATCPGWLARWRHVGIPIAARRGRVHRIYVDSTAARLRCRETACAQRVVAVPTSWPAASAAMRTERPRSGRQAPWDGARAGAGRSTLTRSGSCSFWVPNGVALPPPNR